MAVVISPLILSLIVFLVSFFAVKGAFGPYLSALSLLIPANEPLESTVPENVFVPYEEIPSTDGTVAAPDEISIRDIDYPKIGELYGRITFVRLGLDVDLRFNDNAASLKGGNAGQYYGTLPVGFGSPVLICGHNNGKFNNLQYVEIGDEIKITTSYGIFVYQVTALERHTVDDKSAFNLNQDKEQLILYTCYPFYTLGLTNVRYFVYADKISGPLVRQ